MAAALLLCAALASAGQPEPPPDPGFEASVQMADAIVDVEILAGGPFRAIAQTKKAISGNVPPIFELEGYNSYNWDTVHQGFAAGQRFILFLSATDKPDVFAPLTPAAPRLSIQTEGVLMSIGDPPFRIPIKRAAMEEALTLLIEARASGKSPDRAEAFVRGLWDGGDIEPRYMAVAMAGALRDKRLAQMVIDASKDKLLKLRLTAIDALGKINTPETLSALRLLLKDERATVSREAARVLVASRDADSLHDLLEWVRRSGDSRASGAGKGGPDPNKAKTEAVASEVMKFAAEAAPLLEADTLSRPLLELTRSSNESIARDAIQILGSIGQGAQISALLEIADDRISNVRGAAEIALQRATMTSFSTLEEFRSWWKQNASTFGEDMKRDRAESAAKKLLRPDENTERRTQAEILRAAPGGVALISAAPLLLKSETFSMFGSDDLALWNSPLTLPFLLERLGSQTQSDRRDALSALMQLSSVHPRLRNALWPLLRGALTDEDNGYRRAAQNACSRFQQPDAIPALLDVIQYSAGYEGQDAGKALYQLTARTLGFSINEPLPEANAGRRRLRGWWEGAQTNTQLLSTHVHNPVRVWPELDSGARAAKLDALLLSADSRRSSAAFALAFGERPASHAIWKKLLGQGRQRDRAHGIVGMIGSDAAAVADFSKILFSKGDTAEPPLLKALSVVALASVEPAVRGAGAEKLLEWHRALAKEEFALRRLGIVCLGLYDKESRSLSYLDELAKSAASASEDEDAPAGSESAAAMLPSILVALNARSDSSPLLAKILDATKNKRVRETIARTLSTRRYEPAVAGILTALEQTDRYDWQDLSRALDPLLKPADAAALTKLLETDNQAARTAAAWLLAQRPEVGTDAAARGALVTALGDRSSMVRYYCAEALGKRRAVSAIKDLVGLLKDDDDDVRAAAAEALGSIGDKESCEAVAAAAENQFRLDSRWLKALAIAGQPDALKTLIKLTTSSSYIDQRAGLEALAASESPLALQTLLKAAMNDELAMQTVAADALARRGNTAVAALQTELKNPDKRARARAIQILARIPAVGSRSALAAAAEDNDPQLKALAEFAIKRHDSLKTQGAAK
ncbi:MAG TPA: HEAT repeat domain-containing protein [Planctomycetota bacterium]|nr:HEAT repeat domain-containing protein [Planctomycetota bacterium]